MPVIDIVVAAATWFGLKLLEAVPGKTLDGFLQLLGRKRRPVSTAPVVYPYPPDCGDHPIDLGFRKPWVSEAFGGYLTGLLEDADSYVRIDEQIDCPITPETVALAPTARILFEMRRPTGPRLVVIAADGGMGKTTLATKIVRCLYEQQDAEFILGDSAKSEHIDVATGHIFKLDQEFKDTSSLYRRLYAQIGLPPPSRNTSVNRMVEELNEQLHDFSAVIVLDNLDSVPDTGVLLSTLSPLLGKNIRAVVTTREIVQVTSTSPTALVVKVNPLDSMENAVAFLEWHVRHFQRRDSNLAKVAVGFSDKRLIRMLIKKTGGVPLVMQLAVNDVARKSWDYIKQIPDFRLSSERLDYLYRARWVELDNLGAVGLSACQVLEFVAAQQRRGKRVTSETLRKWAQKQGMSGTLDQALFELEARFLIRNTDVKKGSFSIFPSLADFVQRAEK